MRTRTSNDRTEMSNAVTDVDRKKYDCLHKQIGRDEITVAIELTSFLPILRVIAYI